MKTRTKTGFKAIDFSLGSKRANLAEITLTERYPATGFAKNVKSEMLVYILRGKVAFTQQGRKIILHKGTAESVKSKKKYFWQPLNRVTLIVFSTPPWTAKQHKNVQ